MATNVLLPQWGMNMEDGTLTRWLVNEGDEIAEGQPLVEVETAKINSELESPATGVVSHIMAAEGSLVKVGELVAVIGEPGEDPPRPEPGAPTSRAGARRRQRRTDGRPRGGGARQVTPVARRLARDNGIDRRRGHRHRPSWPHHRAGRPGRHRGSTAAPAVARPGGPASEDARAAGEHRPGRRAAAQAPAAGSR